MAGDLREILREARNQIEYLHDKFGATGSGNAVIARIDAALAAPTLTKPWHAEANAIHAVTSEGDDLWVGWFVRRCFLRYNWRAVHKNDDRSFAFGDAETEDEAKAAAEKAAGVRDV